MSGPTLHRRTQIKPPNFDKLEISLVSFNLKAKGGRKLSDQNGEWCAAVGVVGSISQTFQNVSVSIWSWRCQWTSLLAHLTAGRLPLQFSYQIRGNYHLSRRKKNISYLFRIHIISKSKSIPFSFTKRQAFKNPKQEFQCSCSSTKSKLKSSHGTTNLGAKWRCKNVSRCDTTPDSDHGRTNGENHHSRFAF